LKHSCPDCGEPLDYISEYDRYYCNRCHKYPESGRPSTGAGYPQQQGYGPPPRKRSVGASVILAIGLVFMFLGVGASIASTVYSSEGDYVGSFEASIVALILIVIAIIFLSIGYGVQHMYKKKMTQTYGPNWAGASSRGPPPPRYAPRPDYRDRPRTRPERSYNDEHQEKKQTERQKIPKFCPECGDKTSGTKFCISCGAKLVK